MQNKNESVELTEAHKALVVQYKEVKKCVEELTLANSELVDQHKEKDKRGAELHKMIFMTSHKVRQPIAHILGLANVLDITANEPEKLREIIEHIKKSVLELEAFTRELTL